MYVERRPWGAHTSAGGSPESVIPCIYLCRYSTCHPYRPLRKPSELGKFWGLHALCCLGARAIRSTSSTATFAFALSRFPRWARNPFPSLLRSFFFLPFPRAVATYAHTWCVRRWWTWKERKKKEGKKKSINQPIPCPLSQPGMSPTANPAISGSPLLPTATKKQKTTLPQLSAAESRIICPHARRFPSLHSHTRLPSFLPTIVHTVQKLTQSPLPGQQVVCIHPGDKPPAPFSRQPIMARCDSPYLSVFLCGQG